MTAKSSSAPGEAASMRGQLEDLKRLMIMQLVVSGVPATQIAKALGVDRSAISRMVPVREIQKAASSRTGED
jgi:IS30 family transposase